MKRSTTFAHFLRCNLTMILLCILLAAPVGATGPVPGEPDPISPQLIGPTLQWHTFMGSSNNEWGNAVAMDDSGNTYVTGFSYDSWGTPVNAYTGGKDAFIAKLDPSGASQFHTFLGSSDNDDGNDIAVDGIGNLYVVGTSDSTWGSPIAPFVGEFANGFVAKLGSDGALVWLTFLGGSAADTGNGIALDKNGNIYVVGTSGSTWGASPIDPYPGGWYAPYVAKLNSSGALQWNTFWGAGGLDDGRGIAVDGSANVYVTGDCYDTWGTPVVPFAGGTEACVAKLDTDGARQWNTFLGSAYSDGSPGIAVDGSGYVYVVGESSATWGTPVHPRGANTTYDAFVAKLNASDGVRQWNTFLGFSNTSTANAVAVDQIGLVYIVGDTKEGSVFYDAFLAQFDANGLREWTAFLGYTYAHDYGQGIVLEGSSHATVAGFSFDSWGVPINGHSGMSDAFAARLKLPSQVDLAITKSARPHVASPGSTITYTLAFSNQGYLTATGVLVTDTVPITLTNLKATGSGAVITPTGSVSYTWEVQDLGPGAGGRITITGVVSPSLVPGKVFLNTATIGSTTEDSYPDNNTSSVWVLIPSARVFLPLVTRET
jgi:uncharacterized repeat protein (TIGR01451 family)